MSLRANTYVALIGVAFLAVALVFTVTIYAGRAWIHSGERSVAAASMMQVKRALEVELGALNLTARDWASWDDTYRFAKDRQLEYQVANLTSDTVPALDVDVLTIVDSEGLVVGEELSEDFAGLSGAVPALRAELRPGSAIAKRTSAGESVRGILRIGESILIFAARPILHTDESGPPRGTLLIGRYMDRGRVDALGKVADVDLDAVVPESGQLGAAVRAAVPALPVERPVFIDVIRPIEIHAFLRLDDIYGNPALVLTSARPPLSYDMAVRVLTSLVGVFVIGGLVWSLLAFGIVDRTSLSRMTWLRDAMTSIGRRGELTSRIDLDSVARPDEAWMVAFGVNEMLDALEGSHHRIVQSEEHHRVLVESMVDAVLTMSADGTFTFANPEAESLTGWSRSELLGMKYPEVLARESRPVVERALVGIAPGDRIKLLDVQFTRSNGRVFPVELSISPVCDQSGNLVAVHWIARDVTERKRFEDQLLHLASHDHLTGLFNRRRFEEEIVQRLAESRRHGDGGALMWIDIDRFKEINDRFGHRTGDEVLARVASTLIERTREEHVLCRLGGDEFAVLIPRGGRTEALNAAERILNELRGSPINVEDRSLRLTASVGIALFPEHASTVDELLLHSDIAMYRAKELGRNRVCVFAPGDDWPQQLVHRREWADRIEDALAGDSLVAFAQPILKLDTNQISGFELLVRMRRPDGDDLLPEDFLGAAEDLGMITDIDRWMVRRAIELVAGAGSADGTPMLYVNLSARTLADATFPGFVRSEFEKARVDPARFGFELTETALVGNMARARDFVDTLRAMGCRFALDDFGSGFSSLNYLRHMPVDLLKIDGSLIREIPTSVQDQHLVRAIVELARCLEIRVTAEFVESEEVLDFLRAIRVDYVQGHYIGSPGFAEATLRTGGLAQPGGGGS